MLASQMGHSLASRCQQLREGGFGGAPPLTPSAHGDHQECDHPRGHAQGLLPRSPGSPGEPEVRAPTFGGLGARLGVCVCLDVNLWYQLAATLEELVPVPGERGPGLEQG